MSYVEVRKVGHSEIQENTKYKRSRRVECLVGSLVSEKLTMVALNISYFFIIQRKNAVLSFVEEILVGWSDTYFIAVDFEVFVEMVGNQKKIGDVYFAGSKK